MCRIISFWGGCYRVRVKCYGRHWYFGATLLDQYAELARKAVASALKVLPMKFFDVAPWTRIGAIRYRQIC